jgi:hypothetical protein
MIKSIYVIVISSCGWDVSALASITRDLIRTTNRETILATRYSNHACVYTFNESRHLFTDFICCRMKWDGVSEVSVML